MNATEARTLLPSLAFMHDEPRNKAFPNKRPARLVWMHMRNPKATSTETDLDAKASSQREKCALLRWYLQVSGEERIEHPEGTANRPADVNGLLVTKGRVCFYANPDRGEFQPHLELRFRTPPWR